jgi:hypothetical protein
MSATDKAAMAKGYIPVPQDAFAKAEADAKESDMTVSAWVTYLIRTYEPPQDGPVDDD